MDDDRPFDAVESYLSETESEPSARWRTVSLVTAMLGIIKHGPEFKKPTPEARREAFQAAADELSARGLDAVGLVRYGMSQEVTASLTAALFVGALLGEKSPVDYVDSKGWCDALGIGHLSYDREKPTPEKIGHYFEGTLLPAMQRVHKWIRTASLEEIIAFAPPPPKGSLSSPAVESVDHGLAEQYRWAVDHFAKTFLTQWETASLHYELRWLDGDILPICPEDLMRDRNISRAKVTEEIARRAAYNSGSSDADDSLVFEMSRHALKLLKEERYREAAALFEFGIQRKPEDARMRNNLGFCLIPVDPRAALDHLKSAHYMGYEPSATNAHNRMCCYVLIGRSRAALNIADSEWKRPNPKRENATLWKKDDSGQWELFEADDSYKSIATFAAEIARNEGWSDEEEIWKQNYEHCG